MHLFFGLLTRGYRQIRTVPRRTFATADTQNKGPLHGVRVLDLTRVLAGPYCSMILGDMGAEIIKVEQPQGGDDTRSWGPPFAPNKDPSDSSHPESAYFLGVNRNKQSITINLKSKRGLEIIHRLVKQCDVFIENYIPGKLDSMGLGYQRLKSLNPGLIYASISGYGPDGPFAKKPGYDVIIEGEAGLMHITGEQSRPPVKVGVAVTDLTTGLYAHGAILAALLYRTKTGTGQKIDVSLLETQVASLANIAHSYLIGGLEAQRWGTQHASIVPYQAFKTSDGYIVFGAGNDRQYSKLCECLGAPELASDPRFATNADRVSHREILVGLIENLTSSAPTEHWLEALKDSGIPFGPVNTISQTFAHPQVIHRKMIATVEHPRAGSIQLVGPPVKYSESPCTIRRPPPVLGEHTRVVLRDFCGYSEREIESLVTEGVV